MFWNGSKRQEIAKATDDPASLGNILIRRGFVTQEQVVIAVGRQMAAAPPLGEILIDMGVLTEEQLEEALHEQRKLRGENSVRQEVHYHLTRHAESLRQVAEGLNEITDLSNALVAKLKDK